MFISEVCFSSNANMDISSLVIFSFEKEKYFKIVWIKLTFIFWLFFLSMINHLHCIKSLEVIHLNLVSILMSISINRTISFFFFQIAILKITLIHVTMQPSDFPFSFERIRLMFKVFDFEILLLLFNCFSYLRSFWKYGHRHVFELCTEQPGAAAWSWDSIWFFSLLAMNSFSGCVWQFGEEESSLLHEQLSMLSREAAL